MNLKSHFKTDNNGGFVVSRNAMAILSMALLLLGALIPTVMAYANMEYRITALEKNVVKLDVLDSRIQDLEKKTLVLDEKLSSISKDLAEIKQDVKDIKAYIK